MSNKTTTAGNRYEYRLIKDCSDAMDGWEAVAAYRRPIAQASEQTPAEAQRWFWVARDSIQRGGCAYLYQNEPSKHAGSWVADGRCEKTSGYDLGSDWTQSLRALDADGKQTKEQS